MDRRFSRKTSEILEYSKEEAERLRNACLKPEHLLLGILRDKKNRACEALIGNSIDIDRLKLYLDNVLRNKDGDVQELSLEKQTERILRISALEARSFSKETIEPEHLLLAILKDKENVVAQYLEREKITHDDLIEYFVSDKGNLDADLQASPYAGYSPCDMEDEEEDNLALSGKKRQTQAHATSHSFTSSSDTPVLDQFTTDLTQAATEGRLDPVVGRDKEIERITQILVRRKKNNPILVGEAGVGKTAVAEGLALRIVQRKTPRFLFDKRVVMLDMGLLVSGTKYRGQFEERLTAIVRELSRNKDVILFIDEIHQLIGAGSSTGSMDAADMLKPALSRGDIQCIGATTSDEYREIFEKDHALERRFQKILLEPVSQDEMLIILQNIKQRYEDHHNVFYTPEALLACVKFSERYITDRCLPDKAIDVLDEAGAKAHIGNTTVPEEVLVLEEEIKRLDREKEQAIEEQNYELASNLRDQITHLNKQIEQANQDWDNQEKNNRVVVDEELIAEVVSMMSGVPVQRLDESEHERLLGMSDALKGKLIAQDHAIDLLVKAIQRNRVGLKDPNRPIGTFLFLGPTGVGKTYLSKLLAEWMFGSQDALIRIDMSEYMEKHNSSRLIGPPPGYVGYEEGGQLTEKVRRKPYSIILLDEIEKAHSDIYNLLLQIMDEGHITDNFGHRVDFKNTIIIMTSNIGTRQLKEFGAGIGFTVSQGEITKAHADEVIKKALRKTFSPEFLNRVDEIVTFDPLEKDDIRRIIELELVKLIDRVAEQGYHLIVSEEMKDKILEEGFDIQYGARPLKRAIQAQIENIVVEKILSGELQPGGEITI